MIFYLVRHGQTDWNIEKRMQGHADIPLNKTGIRQMNDLANRIAKAGIRFHRLVASPLSRAKQSAEIIVEKTGFSKEIVIDENFIERDCGLLEGEIWRPDLVLTNPRYEMETVKELCDRAEKALEPYLFNGDEAVMIVSHGAILTAVRTVLSDHRIAFSDRKAPVIQGNVLRCLKEEGKDAVFSNLF